VRHLHNIRAAIPSDEPVLVSVILDGENCWEHYYDGGVSFLRTLYSLCTTDKQIRSVKLGEYLESNPPRDTLPHLFAGSWIHHNYAIWIGHEEDNTAWDLLHKTREHLRSLSNLPIGGEGAGVRGRADVRPETLEKAWEELYIAEGSDWFWWYGDDHSSLQDALFDQLFRKHLQNVYQLLGEAPPAELSRPIKKRGARLAHTLPLAFLDVRIDGQETYFEWSNAGRYACVNERGTMALAAQGALRDVYFGFDHERFLLRIDFDQSAKDALKNYDVLRIGFEEPHVCELRVFHPGKPLQSWKWYVNGQLGDAGDRIAIGIERIAECAIPFDLIGADADQHVQFYVELQENQQSRDRAPREGNIAFLRPAPEFESILWDV
jgi:hypothetical protein